jgi:hypothetical protein
MVRWLTSGSLPRLTQPLEPVPMNERAGFVPRDLSVEWRRDLLWAWEMTAPEWLLEIEGQAMWGSVTSSLLSRRSLVRGTLVVLVAASTRQDVRRAIGRSLRRRVGVRLGF